jgi:hypothetical protein
MAGGGGYRVFGAVVEWELKEKSRQHKPVRDGVVLPA